MTFPQERGNEVNRLSPSAAWRSIRQRPVKDNTRGYDIRLLQP
jgi:hypothetical protein